MDSTLSTKHDTSSYSLDDWIDRSGQYTPDEDTERWVSYSITDLYPDWQLKAHCAGVGVENYFGNDIEQPTMSIKQVRQASKLCDVCPVYTECLTWALERREEYGVWAGTSGRVRRNIFKMLDNGLTTVDEVVERLRNGESDRYRIKGKNKDPHRQDQHGQEGHRADEGRAPGGCGARGLVESEPGLQVADSWEAAL
jgi:WhiB family redox-sensing transcriptional regulator